MIPRAPSLRAVVFDLDGTLVDSAPDLATAVNGVLAAQGRAPLSVDVVRGLIGGGAKKMLDRAFAASGGPSVVDPYPPFRALYRTCLVARTRPYPGVVPMIAGLRRAGVAIGVCTNKPEDLARDVIDGLGLQVFIDHLVGGDTLPVKKPDPAPVLAVLRHLGVPPEAAVMVGDTDADIGAGEAAGMPTVGVTWGYGAVDGATMTIHGADELLPLLGLP